MYRLLPITERGLLTVVNKLLTITRRNFSKHHLSVTQLRHETVIKRLLEKGPDVEYRSRDGQMPLLWAAEGGHEAVVKLLLEKGADVESKNRYYGYTPLLM